MRKLYDCFTFYNEFDLLELRLEEHWDYVDYFVIAEANKTHQGHAKPFFLEENWDRYKKYHEKIIHIKVDDMPTNENAWVLENFQRNAVSRGLVNAADDDVIIISDCDEVMRGETFEIMREDTSHSIWVCRSPMFYFKLNYMMVRPGSYFVNGVGIKKSAMSSPQEVRNMTIRFSQLPVDFENDEIQSIQHAGWHFTYFGNTEHAANKLRNFAHQESNHWADKISVEEILSRKGGIDPNSQERFEYIEIDYYFPEAVVNNIERWNDYILTGDVKNIKEFVPNWE